MELGIIIYGLSIMDLFFVKILEKLKNIDFLYNFVFTQKRKN